MFRLSIAEPYGRWPRFRMSCGGRTGASPQAAHWGAQQFGDVSQEFGFVQLLVLFPGPGLGSFPGDWAVELHDQQDS